MKKRIKQFLAFVMLLVLVAPVSAVDVPSEVTLFKNVNIFDGKSEKGHRQRDLQDG